MKTLIAALWHMTGVICAPLYWLLSVLFLWGGMILNGEGKPEGLWAIWLVLILLVARFAPPVHRLGGRWVNVLGCAIFSLFALIVSVI
ncbi:hypothetical protein [Asticcacaulis sp.]|uniref:hypothetical protein n=1 Tax=Asticcacaulis sp. TaxID=1872648 RepID=UPI0031D9156F